MGDSMVRYDVHKGRMRSIRKVEYLSTYERYKLSSTLRACEVLYNGILRKACERLKNEERGYERYYFTPCERLAAYLKSFEGAYERNRLPRTGDSDIDIIVKRGSQQAHFRLRRVGSKGCLVTAHIEPSDPSWHLRCGLEDKILGEDKKSAVCISFYMDPKTVTEWLEGKGNSIY